jgi:hypothetical protein
MSIADLMRMEEENVREALETLEQLTKEFEKEGFDSGQLLQDIAEQIDNSEIPYQFPAVQRAWVAGKLLTPKLEFNRESAYEILNYLRSFKLGNKSWNPGECFHQKSNGVYSHTLVAWKVIDDASRAGIFTVFDSISQDGQDEVLSNFVEDNSDYLSYDYYVAHQWGLPVSSPVFDVFFTSLDELVENFREVCLAHNFHDVVEVIENFYFSLEIDGEFTSATKLSELMNTKTPWE